MRKAQAPADVVISLSKITACIVHGHIFRPCNW